MSRVLILLGAPSSGKGTQAARLAEAMGLPHVATGDLFRENIRAETELGVAAKSCMDQGELVPDSLVVDMLLDRVGQQDCAGGYVLDGFPRTLPQAEALDARMGAFSPTVVHLVVSDETLIQRAAGRLLCKGCNNIHHKTFQPPSREGICDACGGELYQRADDSADVVQNRLQVYREQTAPLVQLYAGQGLLTEIDGERTREEVFQDLEEVMGGAVRGGEG